MNDPYGEAVFTTYPGDTFSLSGTNLQLSGGGYGDQNPNNDTVYFTDATTESQDGRWVELKHDVFGLKRLTYRRLRLSCNIRAVPVGSGYGCGLLCSSGGRTINVVTTVNGKYVWEIQAVATEPTFTPMIQAAQ